MKTTFANLSNLEIFQIYNNDGTLDDAVYIKTPPFRVRVDPSWSGRNYIVIQCSTLTYGFIRPCFKPSQVLESLGFDLEMLRNIEIYLLRLHYDSTIMYFI